MGDGVSESRPEHRSDDAQDSETKATNECDGMAHASVDCTLSNTALADCAVDRGGHACTPAFFFVGWDQ